MSTKLLLGNAERHIADALAMWRTLAFGVVVFCSVYVPSVLIGTSELLSAWMATFFMLVALMAVRLQQPLSLPRSFPFWLKRYVDVLVASVLLVVLMPIFIIISLLIRMSSPGPIIFHQTLVGYNGRRFELYRFRTMTYSASVADISSVKRWSESDDPRITRVGRYLRRTGLGGLPQLWNVLRGDMSLVGPRPMPQAWFDYLGPNATKQRISVLPGMIGWAALFVTPQSTPEKLWTAIVKQDAWYVRHWSPWLDFIIILRATGIVIKRGPGRALIEIPDVPPPVKSSVSKAKRRAQDVDRRRHAHAH